MDPKDDPPPFPPFPIAESEQVYDSPWCRLRRDMVELSSGRLQEYHVFEMDEAVSVVPVLPSGEILMLWQYRHPHGKSHWEIPAGRINVGEEPAAAAERELREETGYRAGRIERVAGFYPTNGISSHFAHIYVAHNCVREAAPELDDAERLSVHIQTADAVRRRLIAGGFEDGFTALALHYHFAR